MKHFLSPKLVDATLASLKDGTIFTVIFEKANGEERTMNCRFGVKKHLRGGKSSVGHISHLRVVFDHVKHEYRCINIRTVLSIKARGATIQVS